MDGTFPIKDTMQDLQQITNKKYTTKMYASYSDTAVSTVINKGPPYVNIFLKFTYMVSVNSTHMCISYCMRLYGCRVYVHIHDRTL